MSKRQSKQNRLSGSSVWNENDNVKVHEVLMNGSQNMDDSFDCASLPHSYHNEWKKLFLRNDYLKDLKCLAMKGFLRSSRFRSVAWKIFMGVLPENVDHWVENTREYRSLYDDFKMQMIVNPRKAEPKDLSINNPLSQVVESPWNQFFIDNALRLTIKQDVIRTFPEINFFNTSAIHALMLDVLFMFAKNFPHIAYMQGMHELLAPLIFVLHCDQQAFLHACETDSVSFFPDKERKLIKEIMNPEYLEHDAFAIFCKMMETVEPWYVSKEMPPVVITNSVITTPFARPQELIPSNVIVTKLTRVQDYLLKRFDLQLFEHLQKLDIAPQVYGIRWIRLLFGREFPFQDLLILWDAIFADGIGFDLVDYIFVAMLMYLRRALLCSDYSSCLTPLMKFPPVPDVHYFINKALYLRDPKNKPQIDDQFYCKPTQTICSSEDLSRRNGEAASISSRFSRLVRGKRPGSLFISSGLMSKSTSEPMNLITDSALSPVKENFQFKSNRKGSSASLPPPDVGTPLLSSSINNFSCQSLHRLDSAFLKAEQTGPVPDSSTGSPHGAGKFFIFGARGARKNLNTAGTNNKAKQMKVTSEQEVLKALNSYCEMETICRRCAVELENHIGTLQKHLFKKDSSVGNSDDEIFLALAGIKQIRDILKGAVKPSFWYDSPEHLQYMTSSSGAESSLGGMFAPSRRKQPVSAQSSLSGTPMYEKPYGRFFLATPDTLTCEMDGLEISLEQRASEVATVTRNKSSMMFLGSRTPLAADLLPAEVELGEVNQQNPNEIETRVSIAGNSERDASVGHKSSVKMVDDFNKSEEVIRKENDADRDAALASPTTQASDDKTNKLPARSSLPKQADVQMARKRDGSPMDRIADMFRSFGKF